MAYRAPPDWERARHEYEQCPDSLDVIARRNGMSRTTLFARAKADGWERKVKTIWRQRRGKDELAALAVETSRRVLGTSIAGRLYRAIDRKLQEIEKRMSERPGGELQSAAEVEREARSLTTLARLYARLVELDEAARTSRAAEAEKQESAKEMSQDADRLRQDLALPIAFGDFARGYLVVDRAGIWVLRDPYSAKPYVLFYTTKRVGGGVQDFDAIKLLKFGTS